MFHNFFRACFGVALVVQACGGPTLSDDWPMLGRDGSRNSVSREQHPPLDWDIGTYDFRLRQWNHDKARNLKWKAQLGNHTIGAPVVAGGQVYVGTNSGAERLERYPADVDLGCLLCFRETDGEFLWQFSAEKLPSIHHDWPYSGIGASPLVEGNRMWFVSNRREVVCLDTDGFFDSEDDGLVEARQSKHDADVVWRFDMIEELGIHPCSVHLGPNRHGSPAVYGDRIYVVTGNGADRIEEIPAPDAPSLICLDKKTGRVHWTDASPGKNILNIQISDPLVVEIDGRPQVVVGQGDGWIRSFDAMTGALIWKFDVNAKESRWISWARGDRMTIVATPVFYQGRIYVGSGRQYEGGAGQGRLVCTDATKTGDISSELAFDANGRAIPHRRLQAVDREQREQSIPNPNSGLIWDYSAFDQNENNEHEFEEVFHRTLSSVAIKDNLLIAADLAGLVHCLDAETGEQHWTYDTFGDVVAAPLIVDNWVYVGDSDGDIAVFRLSSDPSVAMKKVDGVYQPLAEVFMHNVIWSSPVFANGVLYIATRSYLWAIASAETINTGEPCSIRERPRGRLKYRFHSTRCARSGR